MEKSKITRIFISILCSLALWIYVINVVNPLSTTTIRNIPVKLTGTKVLADKNLAITGNSEFTVDLSVKATRTDLATLSVDNFIATADVAGLTLGQDYITVEVSAPSGYSVEDIRSRKIQVYVDTLETKTVPVTTVINGSVKNLEPAVLKIHPLFVELSGAKQIIDNVDAYVVNIESTALKYEEVSSLTVKGNAVDSSGNILKGVASNWETIDIEASLYSTKTVPFKVNLTGKQWEGASVLDVSYPKSITIKGSSSALTQISEVESKDVNIEGVFESITKTLEPKLPEGVMVSDKEASLEFKMVIAENGSLTLEYSADEIQLNNLGSTFEAEISEDKVTITVSGPVGVLKTISKKDINVNIDASKMGAGTKDGKLNVSTQIPGVTTTVNPSTIKVKVTSR